MCVAGGALIGGIASTGLGIASTLLTAYARQKEQERIHNDNVWATEGRNIAKHGKALRDRDAYNQAAGAAIDTATRAYYKEQVELDQAISRANLASQTNLVNLIRGYGKVSTKGGTADRVNMQAIKDWGRKDAASRHGVREKVLGTEFNQESAQNRAGDAIKIARTKLGGSTIFEPTPQGPEGVSSIPEIALGIGQGLFDLWSSNSGQSPFNSPGNSGGMSFGAGMNSGLPLFGNYTGLSATPYSGLGNMPWPT